MRRLPASWRDWLALVVGSLPSELVSARVSGQLELPRREA